MASNGVNAHEYVLGRDYLASARLNLQHYLWVQELGYHIHPKIAAEASLSSIADVATGTGIWMLDLAKQMPNASFHGFDVSLDQAPPKEWLPGNVKLDELDLFEPLPDHLVERFDIVHVRLLMCVIKSDPRPFLRTLMKMLKPGGYLQWGEMDHLTHRFDTARPDCCTEANERAGEFPSELGEKDSRMNAKWIGELASHFRAEGMEIIVDEHDFRKPGHLQFYGDVAFMVWEEWRAKMNTKDSETYREIIDKALAEREGARRGISINMEIRTVVGRKKQLCSCLHR